MTANATSTKHARRNGRAGAFALLGFAACVLWAKPMGLLFWARIRILTNIPRTAIADDPRLLASELQLRGGSSPEAAELVLPGNTRRNPFAPAKPANPHDPTPSSDADHAGEAKSANDSVE